MRKPASRLLVIITMGLAASALLWVVLGGVETGPKGTQGEAQAAEAGPSPDLILADSESSEAGAEPSSTDVAGRDRLALLGQSAELAPAIPEVEQRSTRIVTGPRHTPVPGASVRYVRADGNRTPEPFPELAQPGENMPEFEMQEADEEGRVFWSVEEEPFVLLAEHEGLFGALEVRAPAALDHKEVVLRKDRSIDVLVVDPAGQPVPKAPVSVRYHYFPDEDGAPVDVELTSEEGRARFEHFQVHAEEFWGHEEHFTVGLAGLFEPPVEARVNMEAIEQELVLEAPESVWLEIEVLDDRGERFEEEVFVRIETPTQRKPAIQDISSARENGEPFRVAVGAGLVLSLTATADLRGRSPALEVFASSEAGTVQRVQITLPPSPLMAIGRAVLEDGLPLCDASLYSGVLTPTKAKDGEPQTDYSPWRLSSTGAGGELRIDLATVPQGSEWVETEWIASPHGESSIATIRLPSRAGGDFNLGDVLFRREPLLVSGRVLSDTGEPIYDARISIYSQDSRPARSVFTDSDGRFTVTSSSTSPSHRLYASHPAYTAISDVPIQIGSRNVEVVLGCAGEIAGSLLTDPDWLVHFAWILFRSEDGEDGEDWGDSSPDVDGRFVKRSLSPGLYTVEVLLEGDAEPAITIPGVEVVAGELSEDPRLQRIDLREHSRFLQVNVVDLEGRPIDDVKIYTRECGKTTWSEDYTSSWDGLGTLFTTASCLDIYLLSGLHEPLLCTEVRDGETLVLEPPRSVTFAIEGAPHQLLPGYRATSRVLFADEGLPARSTQVEFGPDLSGSATTPTQGASRGRVHVTLLPGETHGVDPPRPQAFLDFELAPDVPNQTITLPWPEEFAEFTQD